MFDNKIAGQPDFQFSAKGGDQWKGKVERYLISQVAACYALFHWAERQSQPITQARFEEAVGYGLTVWGREGGEKDHSYSLSNAVWGFLSLRLAGEAQTIFKQAGTLMGWRRGEGSVAILITDARLGSKPFVMKFEQSAASS